MGHDINSQERILDIFYRLMEGKTVSVSEEAENFCVNQKTIKRDITHIRDFLLESNHYSFENNDIVYDRGCNKYYLSGSGKLSYSEILAVCKILIESRAFTKERLDGIIERLVSECAASDDKKEVEKLILNEKYHYTETRHHKDVVDMLSVLGEAVKKQTTIEVTYHKLSSPEPVVRELNPVGIFFSDYYFYMMAFINDEEKRAEFKPGDDIYPTVYRLDRIESFRLTEKKFCVPYKDRFEEGEFRKRIQFMYGGELLKVKFKCQREAIEAALDRLPTAEIVKEFDDYVIIKAEVFGRGIKRWFLSQQDSVEVLEPQSMREQMKDVLVKMLEKYNS